MSAYGRDANICVVTGCNVSKLRWWPAAWWRWVVFRRLGGDVRPCGCGVGWPQPAVMAGELTAERHRQHKAPHGEGGCAGGVGAAHRPRAGGPSFLRELRFAFYGRVSTEDHQDPVTSLARQRAQAGALVAGHGRIVAEFFDIGQSRTLAWPRRPQAAALVAALADPDRGGTPS